MSYLEGHRQRLRDRFNGTGLGAFEDHEVVELLLTYAIPRRDVKPIARSLLDRFGSLAGVLDADPRHLGEVEGVGPTAATLLHLVPALTRRYLRTAGATGRGSTASRTSPPSPSTSSPPTPTRSSWSWG